MGNLFRQPTKRAGEKPAEPAQPLGMLAKQVRPQPTIPEEIVAKNPDGSVAVNRDGSLQFVVETQQQYTLASATLGNIRNYKRDGEIVKKGLKLVITAHLSKLRAYQLLETLTNNIKAIEPLDNPLESKITAFTEREKRRQREEQQKAQQLVADQAKADAARDAEAAKKAGAKRAEVQEIKNNYAIPAVTVDRTYQVAEGQHERDNWKAVILGYTHRLIDPAQPASAGNLEPLKEPDLKDTGNYLEFLHAVIDGKANLHPCLAVEPCMKVLNDRARSDKTLLQIPGVVAIKFTGLVQK